MSSEANPAGGSSNAAVTWVDGAAEIRRQQASRNPCSQQGSSARGGVEHDSSQQESSADAAVGHHQTPALDHPTARKASRRTAMTRKPRARTPMKRRVVWEWGRISQVKIG